MKKVVLMAGIFGLMWSCGSHEESESHDGETAEVIAEEVVEDKVETLQFTSYGLVKEYNEDKAAFLDKVKGNEVVISDVIFKYANVYEDVDKNMVVSGEAPGYMFNSGGDDLFSGYSVPTDGVVLDVNGKIMPEFKDVPRKLDLSQVVLEDAAAEIKQAEKDGADENTMYYHTKGTITVNGDFLTEGSDGTLKLKGGVLSDVINF